MLVSFSIKNFYSIRDKVTISFEANKTKEFDKRFRVIGDKVLSTAMVFMGGNASGKTTVLKGLVFIIWFMFNSFEASSEQSDIRFEPHFFADNDEPSEFEVEFFADQKLYIYSLRLIKTRVLYESLRCKKTTKFANIYERTWNEFEKTYNYKGDEFDFEISQAKQTRENASIMSTAAQYGVELATKMQKNFKRRWNVGPFGRTIKSTIYNIARASEVFYKNKELLVEFNQLVSNLDLGLDAITVEKLESTSFAEKALGKNIEYDPIGIHTFKNKEARLSLHEESDGTKTLFYLFSIILLILNVEDHYPKIAIIDELEADLHPDMLEYIVGLFLSQETNPHGAQLIFTSHNQDILLSLDKYQVAFVEKNQSLTSDVWRLSDMEGIRPDDNIYKKYKAGAYGAKPKL